MSAWPHPRTAGGPEPGARQAAEDSSPVAANAAAPAGANATAGGPVDVRSVALTFLAVMAVIFILQLAQEMLVPLVLGVLVSYSLDPVVGWLVARRVPRSLASALVLCLLVTAAGALAYGLRSEVNAILERTPQDVQRIRQILESRPTAPTTAIKHVQQAADEIEKAAATAAPPADRGVTRVEVEQPAFEVGRYVVWGSIGVAMAIGQFALILFFVYFLLASGDLYKRKLVKIVGPSLTKKKITVQILEEIDRQIALVLLAQAFASALVAIGTWLAFRALGVAQPAVWGLLAGLFTSIPYFGTVIVAAGAAGVAVLQFGTTQMVIEVGATALAISALEGLLLTPWLTRRAARMNAVAVFVGLLFWGWLWSLWGLLLAVPMMMAVKTVCDRVEDFNGVGELLGS